MQKRAEEYAEWLSLVLFGGMILWVFELLYGWVGG